MIDPANLDTVNDLTVGSLFSGIDGMGLGLEAAGWRTIWHSEIDPYASRVLARHWPHVPNLGDITRIDWSGVERPRMICGGFPCQDLSMAGARRGLHHGERSGLWREYMRAIQALHPDVVLIENVPGLLSGGDDYEPADDECVCGLDRPTAGACPACGTDMGYRPDEPVRRTWMGTVLGDLAASGYDTEWDCIPAYAVGAPHLRYRTIIVAFAQDPDPDGRRRESRPELDREPDQDPADRDPRGRHAHGLGNEGRSPGAPPDPEGVGRTDQPWRRHAPVFEVGSLARTGGGTPRRSDAPGDRQSRGGSSLVGGVVADTRGVRRDRWARLATARWEAIQRR